MGWLSNSGILPKSHPFTNTAALLLHYEGTGNVRVEKSGKTYRQGKVMDENMTIEQCLAWANLDKLNYEEIPQGLKVDGEDMAITAYRRQVEALLRHRVQGERSCIAKLGWQVYKHQGKGVAEQRFKEFRASLGPTFRPSSQWNQSIKASET